MRNFRRGVLLLLLVVVAWDCSAIQDSTGFKRPQHTVKFSPFHLLGFYPTVQFAYEYKLRERYSTQFDMGIVVRGAGFDSKFQHKRGVKLRNEWRYYLDEDASRRTSHYMAAEIYYNIINFDRRELRDECFDLNCQNQYRREYNYKMKYREPALTFKMGLIKYFDKVVVVDLNAGLSGRFVNYIKPDFAPGVQFDDVDDGWFQIPNERKRFGLSPMIGIRMGFYIN